MTPVWTTHEELQMFVRARAGWIGQQTARLDALEARRAAEQGRYMYFQGRRLEVVCVRTERNVIEQFEGVLKVGSRQPPSAKRLQTRLASWLSQQAEKHLSKRLMEISDQTGLVASGLQVKTYTARWGSCRHDGVIQLNWKLIMAPCEVIDYVILHELCHLRYFNHSPAFWSLVARHEPDYRSQRQWLKENGQLLLTATV